MQKTSNFNLNKPEAADPMRIEDFNQNADLIDAALAGMPKIVTGNYVGTGTYGKDNPTTLTFPFPPKVVGIVVDAAGQRRGGTIFVTGQTKSSGIGPTYASNSAYDHVLTWSGNSISWYAADTDTALDQLNDSANTYYYFAIG